MVYVPTTSTTEYSVNVQSLTFGGIELLNWRDTSEPNAIPAILDTGTTCLVIPDSGGYIYMFISVCMYIYTRMCAHTYTRMAHVLYTYVRITHVHLYSHVRTRV